MLSKVFVNIKTALRNHCTQCLYWLNFFFWAYYFRVCSYQVPISITMTSTFHILCWQNIKEETSAAIIPGPSWTTSPHPCENAWTSFKKCSKTVWDTLKAQSQHLQQRCYWTQIRICAPVQWKKNQQNCPTYQSFGVLFIGKYGP